MLISELILRPTECSAWAWVPQNLRLAQTKQALPLQMLWSGLWESQQQLCGLGQVIYSSDINTLTYKMEIDIHFVL